MNFAELRSNWSWRPIRNCPGRFFLLEMQVSPEQLIGSDVDLTEYQVEKAGDTVIVGQIIDGGLISYRKKDRKYLHTLNTIAGFERKLTQLGIKL